MPDILHVVVILESVKEALHVVGGILIGQGRVGTRHHFNLGADKLVALSFQIFAHCAEIIGTSSGR